MKRIKTEKKYIAVSSLLLLILTSLGNAAPTAKLEGSPKESDKKVLTIEETRTEKWKADRDPDGYQLSALAGIGRVGTKTGFALMGGGAFNLVREGWLDDVSDSIYLEFQVGPYVYSGNSQLMTSAHLKWDFRFDEAWTFYGIGGLGATYTDEQFEKGLDIYPRVGLGAMRHLSEDVSIRAEVSHELMGLGMSYHF